MFRVSCCRPVSLVLQVRRPLEARALVFYDSLVVPVLSVRPPDVALSPPPVEKPTVAPCMLGRPLDRNYPDIAQKSAQLGSLVRSRIFYSFRLADELRSVVPLQR